MDLTIDVVFNTFVFFSQRTRNRCAQNTSLFFKRMQTFFTALRMESARRLLPALTCTAGHRSAPRVVVVDNRCVPRRARHRRTRFALSRVCRDGCTHRRLEGPHRVCRLETGRRDSCATFAATEGMCSSLGGGSNGIAPEAHGRFVVKEHVADVDSNAP